jgi:hypothetical protein
VIGELAPVVVVGAFLFAWLCVVKALGRTRRED